MKVNVEYITPKLAEAMLQNNPNNRKLERKRVERFAGLMRRGSWTQNGASIVMNGSTLLDGQHRLHALIAANVTLPMVVVRDVPATSFATIDTGKSRTLADYLEIGHVPHASTTAAAIRQFLTLQDGSSPQTAYSGSWMAMTFDEMARVLADFPQIAKSVEFVYSVDMRPPMAPSTLAALHAIFTSKEPGLADRYVTSIAGGTNLAPGSVEESVYSRLVARARGQVRRLKATEKVYMVIRGWNMLRRGEPLKGFIRIQPAKDGTIRMPAIE